MTSGPVISSVEKRCRDTEAIRTNLICNHHFAVLQFNIGGQTIFGCVLSFPALGRAPKSRVNDLYTTRRKQKGTSEES